MDRRSRPADVLRHHHLRFVEFDRLLAVAIGRERRVFVHRNDRQFVRTDCRDGASEGHDRRSRVRVRGMKLGDESVREVAGRLGISESAVKITAHRGYQALKRLLRGTRREN